MVVSDRDVKLSYPLGQVSILVVLSDRRTDVKMNNCKRSYCMWETEPRYVRA